MWRIPTPPPEALRKERQERSSVDSDQTDARLTESPSVDVDDRGRAGEGLDGADDGRGDHEDAREEEHRDTDFARPGDAEAEEQRGRDAQDGDVGEHIEDDEGPEVLGTEGAVWAGEGFDLPVVIVPAGPFSSAYTFIFLAYVYVYVCSEMDRKGTELHVRSAA